MGGIISNQYSLPHLPGIEPQTRRVFQDLVDQINYLNGEVDRLRGGLPNDLRGLARRENPQKGIITIPSSGTDGFIRVNEDGVIVSYANPINSIFPYVDLRTVGNVTTGLDPLHSFTVPAGTLAVDGDGLFTRYAGTFANTEADKQIQITLDAQVVSSFAGVIDLEAESWLYDIFILRTSSTTFRASVFAMLVNLRKADGALVVTPSGGFVFAQTIVGTVSNFNTTPMVLLVSGEGTNTDDIVQTLSYIDIIKPKTVKLT